MSCGWEGKRKSNVTDLGGLSIYTRAQGGGMSTPVGYDTLYLSDQTTDVVSGV